MPLYHFTDASNQPSIQRSGLLSWKRLVQCGIAHRPASSGLSRSLDLRKGLEDYVRLTLSTYHPMAYLAEREGRVKKLVWLTIDERVLRFHARFSNTNATSNDATINEDPRTALDSDDPQAEVLIPGFIALRWIRFPPSAMKRGA